MKTRCRRFWLLLASLGLLTAGAALRAQTAAKHSTWDGVYTEAQAKRGAQVYGAHCVNCHGESLQGDGTASALTGPGFASDWDGITLGEMLDRTRTTMPDDNPGAMSRQQIADVLAYVLSVNKFPAGETDLPTQADALSQIKYIATKPGGKTGSN